MCSLYAIFRLLFLSQIYRRETTRGRETEREGGREGGRGRGDGVRGGEREGQGEGEGRGRERGSHEDCTEARVGSRPRLYRRRKQQSIYYYRLCFLNNRAMLSQLSERLM